jgi:HAD superfamily hydrolase (TIGR01484 family)
MNLPFKLISTDFDGTIFAEFENPPIPESFQQLIRDLQNRGVRWVINTGRDMGSLMEALGRARISVQPDYLVLVEREIHIHDGVRYVGVEPWNSECTRSHRELFAQVRPEVPRLTDWVNARFNATIYEDAYSPFCWIAADSADADAIHAHVEASCRGFAHLAIVRNDVYARFSHDAYNKGTALSEVARRLGIPATQVLAAGDHLNDLPMLARKHAHWLAAPQNAIVQVKTTVTDQEGYVSKLPHGNGIAEAIAFFLQNGAAGS